METNNSEPTQTPSEQGPHLCPWCSAPVSDPAAARCLACGASLAQGDPVEDIPGVTGVDPALVRGPDALDTLVRAQVGDSPRSAAGGAGSALEKAAGLAAMASPIGPGLLVAGALTAAARAADVGGSEVPEADPIPTPGEATGDAGPGQPAASQDPWRDLPPATLDELPPEDQ